MRKPRTRAIDSVSACMARIFCFAPSKLRDWQTLSRCDSLTCTTISKLKGCSMRTISVRQPYAMLLVRGGKDIENRSWSTEYRGPLLIHAGTKQMTKRDWQWIKDLVKWNHDRGVMVPDITPADIHYGGIVGMVTLTDVVTESASGWFDPGGFGWVITEPKVLPFLPCKGQLGFWEVDYPLTVHP